MKRPNCRTGNSEGRRFCSKCGKPLRIIRASSQAVNDSGKDYCGKCGQPLTEQAAKPSKKPLTIKPTSFANRRYQVKRLLGEFGKKKVELAHDTELDRDIVFV